MASALGAFSIQRKFVHTGENLLEKETKCFIIYFGLVYRFEADEEVYCKIIR